MKSLEEIKILFIGTLESEQWIDAPNGTSFNGIVKYNTEKFIVLFTSHNWINKSVWDYCRRGCAKYGYRDICIVRFDETNNTFKRFSGAVLAMDSVGKEKCFSSFKGEWSVTNSPVYYFDQTNPTPVLIQANNHLPLPQKKINPLPTLKDLQKQIKEVVSCRVEDNAGYTHSAEARNKIKEKFYYHIDLMFTNIANGVFSLKEAPEKCSFFRYEDFVWQRKMLNDIASMIENFN